MSHRRKVIKKNSESILRIESRKKIHFITYGSGPYEQTKRRLVEEARNFYQFKTISDYERKDIDSDFIEKTKGVINLPRGGGYWIWKAHLILKKLNEIDDDEYLIYIDAGCTLNHCGFDRFKEYIQMLNTSETPIIGFQMSHKERNWTTDKIFEYFNLTSKSEIGESGQIIGGVQIMKKCHYTVKLFEKMLGVITEDPFLFTDKYNKETKRNDFKDNRNDQSILSILKKIHGCIILKDETYFESFGKGESLKYPIWATRRTY